MSTADPFLPFQPADDRDVPDDDLDTDVEGAAAPDDSAVDDDLLDERSAQQDDPPFRTPNPGDQLSVDELAEDPSDF